MNPPHAILAALLVALTATAPHAAETARACDAAWMPASAPRLVRLDANRAAITVGPLVLARARLDNPPHVEQTAPAHAQRAISFGAVGVANAWRIRGTLAFDDECAIDLDAELALEPADAQVTRAAAALGLLAQARAAGEDAHPEHAADLATRALDALGRPDASPVLAAIIAGFAIERLIDQRQLGRAQRLADEIRPLVEARLDRAQPAALRFRLAVARLLAWPDALGERQRLQQQLEGTFGAASLPALENRVRLANNLLVLGRGGEALAAFEALEEALRDEKRPAASLRVLLARSHANALSLQGRPKAQITRLRALREDLVRRYGAEDRRVVDVDDDIARGLADDARLADAMTLAARVFLWRDRELGPAHARTQESARVLALLYGRSGRYGTARALLEDLLQRIDPHADMSLTIRAWRDIATWAAMDGEPNAALALMGDAHRAARERFSADSIFAIGLAIDYGWLLVRAGDLRAGCELLDSVRGHAPPANGLREWAEAGYARCLLAQDPNAENTARALALLRSAHGAAVAAVGADNARTLIWQSLLAGAELRAGRRAEAKRLLADFVFRAERNRESFASGTALRDATFGMWIAENDSMAGYRTLALLHAEDGELDEALRVAELARDRQLRDRFAERRWLDLPAQLPERARLVALQAQRQRLDEAIAVADIATRVRLEAQRIEVADSVDRLERHLAQRFPQATGTATPTVAAIQSRLPADTALVAYQRAGDTWWATVIDARAARVVTMRDAANLAPAARAWARHVRGEPVRVWAMADGRWTLAFVRPEGARARIPIRTVAERLGSMLFQPLEAAAREVRRLVVVADDELLGLPLEALAIDARATPAVMRYEITYAASFGGWLELRDRAARRTWPRDLLALGAIDAAGPGEDAPQAAASMQPPALRSRWDPLPFARTEIVQIARSFPAQRVRTLFGDAASKEALQAANRSGELAGYRYVHFATHAVVEPAFAERAALVLAAEGGNEAWLTAAEIAGLTMNAELVVLSACDTGVGRYEPGQGLLGFAFAALAAGNRGAVLSLWPVADDTTARFMARFYARLHDGVAPAAALAATKREFGRSLDARERDPRVWAAFILYGGF